MVPVIVKKRHHEANPLMPLPQGTSVRVYFFNTIGTARKRHYCTYQQKMLTHQNKGSLFSSIVFRADEIEAICAMYQNQLEYSAGARRYQIFPPVLDCLS